MPGVVTAGAACDTMAGLEDIEDLMSNDNDVPVVRNGKHEVVPHTRKGRSKKTSDTKAAEETVHADSFIPGKAHVVSLVPT